MLTAGKCHSAILYHMQKFLMRTPFPLSLMILLSACSSSALYEIPKTPEQNQIAGTVQGASSSEHIIYCPSGESISVALNAQLPDITFDVISAKTEDRIFIGNQIPQNTSWNSGPNCDPRYTVRVYNAAPIVHLPATVNYTLTLTRTD